MSQTPPPPPSHVRAAFGGRAEDPELLEGGLAWRCGEIFLKPAANTAEAAWVAQALDLLEPDDVRIAKPLRSTDGRWVVSGWSATRFIEGRPEPRHDEVIAASLRLHSSSRALARPRFLESRDDIYAVADRMAWEEIEHELPNERGGRLYDVLSASRRPTRLEPQVVHGDLFGNVLFSGDSTPGVIDFTPYWRPVEWAAAVTAVDALAWGGADPDIVHRWSHLAEWPQALLRGLLFRLAVHAMHPRSTAKSLAGLDNAAQVVLKVL